MLFPRRTWARRITARMDHISPREAACLTSLVIWAAKETEQTSRKAIGFSLPKPEGVLLAATGMAMNSSAVGRVAAVLRYTREDAAALLLRFHYAARDLAADYKFAKVVGVADRERRAQLYGPDGPN